MAVRTFTIAALACASACGRFGFEAHVAEDAAPLADASLDAPADAPPDAAPVLLEMLTVPTDGSTVHSIAKLALGETYTLTVSGTFTAVPPAVDPMADAEYYDMTDPTGGPKDIDTSNNLDFGLAIDTPTVGIAKLPAHWGAYRSDHVYTVTYPGTGKVLAAKLFDCCYGDNTGTLTLQILH